MKMKELLEAQNYQEGVKLLQEAFDIMNDYSSLMFKKEGTNKINEALRNQMEFYEFFTKNPQKAQAFYSDKQNFNKLTEEQKAILAAEQPVVMQAMLDSGDLSQFSSRMLSMIVTSYVINVSAVKRGGGIFIAREGLPSSANDEQRKQICLQIIQKPEIIEKINSAARILLFAFIKKEKLLENNTIKSNLDPNIQAAIDNAYDIRTDYNPEKQYWNKCLWPALAGGFGIGDYIGRISELTSCARYETEQYIEAPDDPKATAEILISHPALSEKLSNGCERGGINYRLALAEKYPHITYLLLKYPEY
jgi:hypothetical protein